MPKPYSADLRERVLLADEAGLPPAAIAQRFGVGLATVYLWRQQAHAQGRRCAKPHGGGRARGIDAAGEAILRALVAERNDRTLDEYREQLAAGRRSAGRPCAAPCGGSGYGAKKDAARQRARSRRHPGGAGSLLRTGAATRRQKPGLPRRERHHHGDDPSLCPRRGAASGHTARPRAAGDG